MATLVLTSIGTALGGPLGGALGALVGQSIDQQLFGPGRRKGPRLGDLSVQTSSYGSPIPRIYGSMRVAGTVIWATDLKEEQAIEGGGKSGPEQVRYLYSVSLAVALSSRPVREVRRIWADGKLVRGADGDFKVKTKFRLKLGNGDQPVDPLIASVETPSETPAYRGLALAVFEDLELAEFGNRIPIFTFEVVADEGEVGLAGLLADASGGLIDCDDPRGLMGFAAHGSSIADGLRDLIELAGVELVEEEARLMTPGTALTGLIADRELGCDSDGENRPGIELVRASGTERPAALALTYYDPERDYQAGQMRSSGGGGSRDERIELPAVLPAADAKLMVEDAYARRWRRGDRLKLRLPPSRMDMRPGRVIQLTDSMHPWVIRSLSIEGLSVAVEAEAAPVAIPALPASPGRATTEPDIAVGRTELALFELPALGEAPDASAKIFLAGSNGGLWKAVPVELAAGAAPLATMPIIRRATMGQVEGVLDARAPLVLDEISTVVVNLGNPAHYLLNVDDDALMAGANLAIIGNELIQFARADQLAAGRYRLSRLLRGRRGSEWAAFGHAAGDRFCMIDSAAMRIVELPPSGVAAMLRATAHGIGDSAPLPVAERLVTGESLRPPSPCHFAVRREGPAIVAEWVRRSHRGWAWVDGVGVAGDPFPELYRLTLSGPGGVVVAESTSPGASFDVADVPAGAGEVLSLAVSTVGPAALSRPVSATIII